MQDRAIADRFRQMRKALHLTQADVARVLGVTQVTISKIENGGTSPRLAAISLICETYGVSKGWLINGTGPMLAPDPEPAEPDPGEHQPEILTFCEAVMTSFLKLTNEEKGTVLRFIRDISNSMSDPDEEQR